MKTWCVCVRVCEHRARQLLLVKIQKLVCRGGKEENESQRNSRVRSFLSWFLSFFYIHAVHHCDTSHSTETKSLYAKEYRMPSKEASFFSSCLAGQFCHQTHFI